MSEPSDDAQPLATKQESVPPPAPEVAPAADDDDIEVTPSEEPPPRHDSVQPTSRKLAPPPKPKRDSGRPSSRPPPAGEAMALGSLKAPSAPAISYQDANTSSRDVVAAALSGRESLRKIGEALAKNAGAFSANESPTGERPKVPRPRSQSAPALVTGEAPLSGVPATRPSQELIDARRPSEPARPRDKGPTTREEVPSSKAPAKSVSPFAQRIIAVGIRSERPPPPPPEAEAEAKAIRAYPSVPPAAPVPVEEAPPDIPISTDDYDEDTPTVPSASPGPIESAPPAATSPLIPAELIPPPPQLSEVDAVARAEQLSDEDLGPDSSERKDAVEELSREDSPSLPPEQPPPMTPPPAPSVRAEGKQPPPPPKRAPAPPPPETTEKKKAKTKRAWWEELFSEDFVRANWKISDEQIRREVTFVEESLGVAPGGVVLDLGCGAGHHAVELASRGYGVVGYDLSLYQLALAADVAQERSQKINFLQGDMREMAFEEMFDGIFCWNTTFGYFEEDKNFSVAERAFRALRPGGMFLVDVINRDFVAAHTPSSMWFEGDSCVCMDDAVIDYFTSRLRVKRSVILDDGRTRECTYSVRLYSFHELGKLLHEVGFRVTEVSGHPATPGVFLGQASPRILMLAQRP
ncbi:MAG TPA: methyltransferase domain-containing protein [Polyangiaceae bacterium]|nr:methyltransferase domain-containing protein [Polyangiaceae bacterium]